MQTQTITLTAPVRQNGKDTNTLQMRPPTIGDIANHGEPFAIAPSDSGKPTVKIISANIINIAADCLAVPVSEIMKLPASDYQTIQNALIPFFAPPDAPQEDGRTAASG